MRYKLPAALAAVLLLTACGHTAASSQTPAPQPSTDSSAPASPTPQPKPSMEADSWLTGNSPAMTFPSTSSKAYAVKARVGVHDGYERVVVEYSEAAPHLTWQASWTDTPTQDGSGFAISMAGTRFLQVDVAGTTSIPADIVDLTHVPGTPLHAVQAVNVQLPFEGMHPVFIGLDEERPYRVHFFENPTRLVVDIKTS